MKKNKDMMKKLNDSAFLYGIMKRRIEEYSSIKVLRRQGLHREVKLRQRALIKEFLETLKFVFYFEIHTTDGGVQIHAILPGGRRQVGYMINEKHIWLTLAFHLGIPVLDCRHCNSFKYESIPWQFKPFKYEAMPWRETPWTYVQGLSLALAVASGVSVYFHGKVNGLHSMKS